jgi:hypothetical protein
MAKGEWTAEPHSWVVGASGYTGQALVARLAERAAGTAATVTAHLRPGRPHTSELRARFEGMGVRVVECPLLEAGPQALAGAFLDRPPTHLFLVHGTTRRRARLEGLDVDPYLTVDLGLTSLALEACRDLTPPPRVVLLSSQGAGPGARGAYLRARHLAEEAVRASGLPYTIARSSPAPTAGSRAPSSASAESPCAPSRAGCARAEPAPRPPAMRPSTPPSWPRASPTRASTTRPSPGSSRRRSSAGRPPWTAWPPSRPRAATTHATEPP